MKFSNAVVGTRAERPVSFQIRGTDHAFAIRPLTAAEDALALEYATAYAQDHKAESARPGNPLFDLGYMLHTLALACMDVDSPAASREPFWTNAAEIEGVLGPEDIAFLHARVEAWQAECSPTRSAMSGAELVGHLIKIAEDDSDLPFSQLRPGLASILLRTTARVLLASPELRSQLTSLFGTTANASPPKPQKSARKEKRSSPPASNSSASTASST